jgi:hypothetical protein
LSQLDITSRDPLFDIDHSAVLNRTRSNTLFQRSVEFFDNLTGFASTIFLRTISESPMVTPKVIVPSKTPIDLFNIAHFFSATVSSRHLADFELRRSRINEPVPDQRRLNGLRRQPIAHLLYLRRHSFTEIALTVVVHHLTDRARRCLLLSPLRTQARRRGMS